ncbi:fused MFS/spermidine synthase [Myxococcota bacterium]|nr:fused MFS/spermidine synthase [Myxococcota bacterium]
MQDPARDSAASTPAGGPSTERGGEASGTAGVVLYAATIFASAFLIFLVQPMVGKRILPWFGGVPAVWTLCLAFYQTALFLGYAYAHLMIRFVKPGLQLAVHALAVAAAVASLPVLPDVPPHSLRDADPTLSVLRLLTSKVAMPFLVLASTGPLVQAWFARAHPTRSPYALYAVSNLGSFLALFAFPFVLEPRLSLTETGRLWTWAFAATGLAVLACALPTLRARRAANAGIVGDVANVGDGARAAASPEVVSGADGDGPSGDEARGDGGIQRALTWLGLSGTAVIVLMGVTNKLCLDVASIPFLWIVPLATYLVTFILCFSSERAYRRGPYVTAAVASFGVTLAIKPGELIVYQVLAYCVLLFSACMCLHGELYRIRPAARALTRFYLFVSAGGALGGLLVGIVAPRIFDHYYELQVGLLFCALMLIFVCATDPRSWLHWNGFQGRWRVVAPLVVIAAGGAAYLELRPDPLVIHRERSFFGVLTVHEIPDAAGGKRTLTNGTTVHGLQFLNKNAKRLPTSYFGRATGLGLALTTRPRKLGSKIGVIGLGVGTLAAYGRKGDQMRFYEIDPLVVRLAGPGGPFSFVSDSKADVEFVLGDARLSIEEEQRQSGSQGYDILVLDAFSSDAIPIHLMTKEAFEGYFRALAPDGLMAVHVSNRHFRLMTLVSRLAAEFGAHSLQIKTRPAPELQSGLTDWVLITRDADELTRLQLRIEKRHRALELAPGGILLRRGSDANLDGFPLWTDDYSDLARVIRWN